MRMFVILRYIRTLLRKIYAMNKNGISQPEVFFAHSAQTSTDQWQLLQTHLVQVAQLARRFATHFNAGNLASAAGLLHDLGKYSIPFQQRLRGAALRVNHRSEEHTSELQSLMRISYAVFCLKKTLQTPQ